MKKSNISYLRRKNKSNLLSKKSSRTFRCIVNRTNKYNYIMVIKKDGNIVAMMSDMKIKSGTKVNRAKILGETMGNYLKEKGFTDIVFDRNGYLYHGRIAAIAEGLRNVGILI